MSRRAAACDWSESAAARLGAIVVVVALGHKDLGGRAWSGRAAGWVLLGGLVGLSISSLPRCPRFRAGLIASVAEVGEWEPAVVKLQRRQNCSRIPRRLGRPPLLNDTCTSGAMRAEAHFALDEGRRLLHVGNVVGALLRDGSKLCAPALPRPCLEELDDVLGIWQQGVLRFL